MHAFRLPHGSQATQLKPAGTALPPAIFSAASAAFTAAHLTSSHAPAFSFDSNTMISVAAYGAVGQGTDATAAIRLAQQAAEASGKALYFGPGTYEVTSTISMHTGDNWIGAPGSVTLEAAPGLSTMLTIVGSPSVSGSQPVSNVSVSGLTFTQESGSSTHSAPLITSWIASHIRFTNDTFQHLQGIGLLLSNTAFTTIDGCSFLDIGNASATASSPATTAQQGIAFTSSDILQSQGNTVSNCSFSSIGLDAISSTDQTTFSATNNVMRSLNSLTGWNLCAAGAAGIYLNQDSNCLVAGNTIEGASGNGIDVLNVSDLYIVHNNVSGSYEAGIAIAAVKGGVIMDNRSNSNNGLHDHFPHVAGITLARDSASVSSNILISRNAGLNNLDNSDQKFGLQIDRGAALKNVSMWNNEFSGTSGLSGGNVTQNFYSLVSGAKSIVVAGANEGIVAQSGALRGVQSVKTLDGGGGTVRLEGAGVFDLRAPGKVVGIEVLAVQPQGGPTSAHQMIYLRDGLDLSLDVLPSVEQGSASATVPLAIVGAHNKDTIHLSDCKATVVVGDAAETVFGGSAHSVFVVNSTTAGATMDGGIGGATLQVVGGGTIVMGGNISRISQIDLKASPATAAGKSYSLYANASAGLTINCSGGADSVMVGSGSETIHADGGAIHVMAAAIDAGVAVLGASGAVLEITTGGSVALNTATRNVVVQLDRPSDLMLNGAKFVTALGSDGIDTITAGGAEQTLVGGSNDTLTGYVGGGDTFAGSCSALSSMRIINWEKADRLDITDMTYSKLANLSYHDLSGGGALDIFSSGAHASVNFTDMGGKTFDLLGSDGHGGTLIGWV